MEGYEFLIEKEEIWARVLAEVLSDNGVPFVSRGLHGVGFVLKTGMQERIQIFVPAEFLEKARELCVELFSQDFAE